MREKKYYCSRAFLRILSSPLTTDTTTSGRIPTLLIDVDFFPESHSAKVNLNVVPPGRSMIC
jgi:hypothetical protein